MSTNISDNTSSAIQFSKGDPPKGPPLLFVLIDLIEPRHSFMTI